MVTGSGNNPFGYKDAVTESVSQSIIDPTGAAGKSRALGDTILKTTVDKSVVAKEPGFLKNIFDGVSNQDYQKVAKTIGDGAKKFGKAMFTDKDGDIDKAAVMGALAFTASYAEARALAAEIGVDDDLTEAEYDELTKADKKAEYASYLTNFFGGVKDGGRIGFRDGTPDKIMEQFYESNDPDANKSTYTMEDFDITREPEVVLVSLQGPDGIKLEKMLKSDAIKYGLNIVADSIPPGLEGETIDLSVLGKKRRRKNRV